MSLDKPNLIIRQWNDLQDYQSKFETMKLLTNERDQDTPDELWLLQHHNVLTQGQA
ncbi:octanoyltransferase, partial [Acinetobacter baumannii]